MNVIRFSHEYPKLHGQTSAELLAVRPLKIDAHTPPEPPDCSRCRHFCGFRQMEIDFDTGDTMETVQCDAQVFATPDMAKHCRHYQRRAAQ